MFNMYLSASVGPGSLTRAATSDKLSVRKVFVSLWMFFLYKKLSTCLTNPRLLSLANNS